MKPAEYAFKRFMELFATESKAMDFVDIPEEDQRDWAILATEMIERFGVSKEVSHADGPWDHEW